MADAGTTLLRTIINRIKELEGFSFEKDVGTVLKMSAKGFDALKHRESVPWGRLVEYSRERQISLEYLVNGHGPAHRRDLAFVNDPGAIYKVTTDQDAVYGLATALRTAGPGLTPEKYQQILRLLHRELLETGKTPPPEKIAQFVKMAL